MDLQEKFNILLTKFNLGKFDEVIFEATLMSKKYPAQEVFINLLEIVPLFRNMQEGLDYTVIQSVLMVPIYMVQMVVPMVLFQC